MGGYPGLVRHFADIDAGNKGYVTREDIRAWRALQRALRSRGGQPDNALRPRPAVHQHTAAGSAPLGAAGTEATPAAARATVTTPTTDGEAAAAQ